MDCLTSPLGKYVLGNIASKQGQRTEILPAKKGTCHRKGDEGMTPKQYSFSYSSYPLPIKSTQGTKFNIINGKVFPHP